MKFFRHEPKPCSICGLNEGTKKITRVQSVCIQCYDKIKQDAMVSLNAAISSGKKMDLKDIRKVSDEITKSLVEGSQ